MAHTHTVHRHIYRKQLQFLMVPFKHAIANDSEKMTTINCLNSVNAKNVDKIAYEKVKRISKLLRKTDTCLRKTKKMSLEIRQVCINCSRIPNAYCDDGMQCDLRAKTLQFQFQKERMPCRVFNSLIRKTILPNYLLFI